MAFAHWHGHAPPKPEKAADDGGWWFEEVVVFALRGATLALVAYLAAIW